MATGKCPKCEKTALTIVAEAVTVTIDMRSWNGVNYLCPNCRTILSVGIDPVALKTDTVRDVLKGLGKRV